MHLGCIPEGTVGSVADAQTRGPPEGDSRPCLGGESLCTDAEVLQEILHRYEVVAQRHDMVAAFDALLEIVYPIERPDVERARRLPGATSRLSARDAIHVAVMQGRDVGRSPSFDAGFGGIPAIVRLS